MKAPIPVISDEGIERAIYLLRGERVMTDADLAVLYDVETGALNRAVKRNLERFPEDFMFQLSSEEAAALRCQIGISKAARGGRRYRPYVFTEPSSWLLFLKCLDGPVADKTTEPRWMPRARRY